MGKIKVIELTDEQRSGLEKGYKNGESHAFRQRCQMILLKSEERTSSEIADILGCCEMAVNNWVKRFEEEGVEGLKTRPGRGRPAILSNQNPEHLKRVEAEVRKHPNSLKTVLGNLEEELDLEMSEETLRRFLKKTVTDSVVSEKASSRGRWVYVGKKKKSD